MCGQDLADLRCAVGRRCSDKQGPFGADRGNDVACAGRKDEQVWRELRDMDLVLRGADGDMRQRGGAAKEDAT